MSRCHKLETLAERSSTGLKSETTYVVASGYDALGVDTFRYGD
jgi:hypothetical protein